MGTTWYVSEEEQRRTTLTVSVPAQADRWSISYDGTFVTGASPFDFDQIDAQSHISCRVQAPGSLRVQIDGGIDLADQTLDPIELTLSWELAFKWRATLTYDIAAVAIQSANVSADWSSDTYSVDLSLPYDAPEMKLGPFEFDLSSTADLSKLSLSGTLSRNGLETLTGSLAVESVGGWGATLQASYDEDRPSRLFNTKYGIFHDIGDCLRIGLERQGGEVWIYGSILAFPDAVLRYAPEAASLQLGD
jgi:hypothetical protein